MLRLAILYLNQATHRGQDGSQMSTHSFFKEFYNQFSLRIISELFWRSTMSCLISIYRLCNDTSLPRTLDILLIELFSKAYCPLRVDTATWQITN